MNDEHRTPWPRHDRAHRELSALLEAVDESQDALVRHVHAEVFAAALDGHMRHETAQVLPRYARECADVPANGASEVVHRDHDILARRVHALTDLSLYALAVPVPGVLLDDRLDALKGTLEHHDLREHRYVYRWLLDATDERTREVMDAGFPDVPSVDASAQLARDLATDPLVASVLAGYLEWTAGSVPRPLLLETALPERAARGVSALARVAAQRSVSGLSGRQALAVHHAWRAALRLAVRDPARQLAAPQ